MSEMQYSIAVFSTCKNKINEMFSEYSWYNTIDDFEIIRRQTLFKKVLQI